MGKTASGTIERLSIRAMDASVRSKTVMASKKRKG
jgi:hypothetical protein